MDRRDCSLGEEEKRREKKISRSTSQQRMRQEEKVLCVILFRSVARYYFAATLGSSVCQERGSRIRNPAPESESKKRKLRQSCDLGLAGHFLQRGPSMQVPGGGFHGRTGAVQKLTRGCQG